MDFKRILDVLTLKKKTISVYAFYGPSGTGKSHHAKIVAQQVKTDVLIDDGLLIKDERIIAGKSAKLESSYMGAVRVALFDDKEHRDSVAKAIRAHHIKSILILGTSEKMILKITTRLQLPNPIKFIKITDIASKEEIEEAKRNRQIEGKHVIPVRPHEIKDKRYAKIFLNSIKIAFGKKKMLAKVLSLLKIDIPVIGEDIELAKEAGKSEVEKSIVRPTFSVMERKVISHAALVRMTLKHAGDFNPEILIKKMSIKNGTSGYKITITADFPFGEQLADVTQKAKDYIIKMVETESKALVEELFIVVDKLIQPKKAG